MSIPAAHLNGGISIPSFLHSVEAELRRVEEVLHAELSSAVRTVVAVSSHILEAGGKRLRPSLVALSAQACGSSFDTDRLVNVAASAELIHMATLMHDDVIDGAEFRRGRVTANSLWGSQVSVLAGDYMLAKAFSLLARDGDGGIMQALSRATIAMTEGEIAQIESRGDTRTSAARYLSIIHDKTAAFMSACCRIGAILADGSASTQEALARYALDLGLAFQITDDLLDLIGDPARTGKPVGGDIREGKVTLPLILLLEKADPTDRTTVERIVQSDSVTSEDVELVRQLAETSGAVESTRDVAAQYVSRAVESLCALAASDAQDSLRGLAEYVVLRES
ncbi:MAG TPA: polyprenyl synthetase family protein [Armatimonadota bacterium]|nr:polyprenyl synthetase family protein [Armatimonadota bacterium]